MTNCCFFNTVKAWGGGEKWHLETAYYLQSKGNNVVLFLFPGSELEKRAKELNLNVVPIRLNNLSFLNPFKVFKTATLLKKHKSQVIVMNLTRDLKCGGIAARLSGIKQIVFRRGSDLPVKNTVLNRFLYNKVITKVIANSDATKHTLLSKGPSLVSKDKIYVIPNGIATGKFSSQKSTPVYIKKENEIVLCTLGRLVKQKNQAFLIDLALALKNDSISFKIIIGGAGPLEAELKRKAKESNVLSNIVFTGFIARPKDLLMSGDIFVLPSLWEGFGYVLAEAGLCELPSVAFSISSNSQVIQDQKTGFLTPTNDIKAFCEAIQRLASDEQLRKQMGSAAKTFVQENFEAEKIFFEIETLLDE